MNNVHFVIWSVVLTGIEEKVKWDDKKRVENRGGSLEYPGRARRGRLHSPQSTTSPTWSIVRRRDVSTANGGKKEGYEWQNGMKLSLLTTHASVSNNTMVGLESGQNREEKNAEQLRYAPPHWSYTGYYGMGWHWITLLHSSSTHCRYFKYPALHLRGVGASCPSLPSALGNIHISTG
ncbi:hypothetical protein TNCV_1614951 [Trichonephila clavipes]|nr:hypothetical protein TNCV_1614951 [Trichonephila clavipes]